jgi:hypothetical protein
VQDRIQRIDNALPRYRQVAYAVSEVVPPDVFEAPETHVLIRGEMSTKGDKVEPGFLTAITGKEEPATIRFVGKESTGRRLALAEWIASPENPLTARVMANRIWQRHFGEGIARTPSDLGMNGDRPSHPELLDWLALAFVEKKWSIKAMHRLMLTSSTYRQSTVHPDARQYAEKDPDNRLLWRMNWIRLDAEVLRDSLLALSGKLRSSPGGPGVYFDSVAEAAEGLPQFPWPVSPEPEQGYRTIYGFQRRSIVMPMMEVFDVATMSESCSRRQSTVVPPQALTLMNSEFVNRRARDFAARVIELAGPARDAQIGQAFQLALLRPPSADQVRLAGRLYENAKPEDALAHLAVVLFNLNEFLYLE